MAHNDRGFPAAAFLTCALVAHSLTTAAADAADLIAYWEFDNTANPGETVDAIGGHSGTLQGGAAFTANNGGRSGAGGDYGIDFGTSNNGRTVHVGDASFLNAAAADDQITISFWQKLYSVASSSSFWMVSPSQGGNQRGMQAHLPWSDGVIYFDSAGCCGAGTRSTANPPALFDWMVWHHFALVKDGGTKQVWIDGDLVLSDTGAFPLPADFTELYLGSEFGNNSMRGVLDEFAIFSGALTEDEIGSLAGGASADALTAVDPDLPDVIVIPVTIVNAHSATLRGVVTDPGIAAPTVTIFYGDEDGGDDAAAWDSSVTLPGTHVGLFSSEVSALDPATTYFFSARATNFAGTRWAPDTETFTTNALAPSIVNTAATNVQSFAATVGATVVNTGGEDPAVTIHYGTADGGTVAENWTNSVSLGAVATSGSADVGALAAGSTYFFRAAASNSGGTTWAAVSGSFTTPSTTAAVVANAPATDITGSSARLQGTVTDTGNDPPAVTIYFGASDGGTVAANWDRAASAGIESASFSESVTRLTPETTYFYRVHAINAAGESWAAGSATFVTPAAAPLSVVINEIHHDADPKTEPAEFVELLNAGDVVVDLSGWNLEGGVDYAFPDGTTLAAGEFLVVAEDPAALQSKFGAGTTHQYAGKLDNDGEEIRLVDAGQFLVDRVDYQSGFPWPTAARGTGSSMELIHPALDNDLGGSWRSSSTGSIDPSVTIIPPGSSWRYRKGTSEASNPVQAWRGIGFVEDGSWLTGDAVFGFGDGDDTTVLSDMQGSYSTIYLRKEFLMNPDEIPSRLLVRVYVDDGAIVWINGVEVARVSVSGGPKDFDDFASSHERAWEEVMVTNPSNVLVGGTNVIAVHGLNATLGSSDFSLDVELRTPDPSTDIGDPSPGAPNSVNPLLVNSAPPAIRQVGHLPPQPAAGEDVVVSAKATDIDGVSTLTLSYQVVDPGDYIRKSDGAYDTTWTDVSMADDGTGGDVLAGDDIYTVTLPAKLQIHRRLVRYRITAEDGAGNSIRVPYGDDESPNFAYFVYDGVPAWTGAERPGVSAPQTFPADLMNNALPVYHLIADGTDVDNSQYNSGSDGTRMWGTMVYDGVVYDHIQFYNRGEASTYVSGKNKWRFKFNRARDFRARDIYGKRYTTTWKTMNFNACASPWVDVNRGMAGIDEAVPHRLYQLAGVPSSNTHWVQFRIVDGSSEAPSDQYAGDLWGLYLAIEHPDGRFLTEHGLPDGNVYKIQGGNGDKKNQGPTQPVNSSDWSSFWNSSAGLQTVPWWRDNFNLPVFFGFRAINRATGNVDLRDETNYYMYHHPDGRWNVMPWDLDMMYAPVMHVWSGVIRADRCLDHSEIRTEFRNRCRELIDLLFSDIDRHGGHAAQVVDELSRVINPPGVPLTMVDMDQFMWSYNSETRGDHRGPWYLPSKVETTLRDNYTRTIPTPDHEGFQQNVINYMHDTDTNGFTVGDGDENGYGFNYLSREAADAQIPDRPTITFTGVQGFPSNGIAFQSSAFSDPQGAGTFAAMNWRIGEIENPSTPSYLSGQPFKYEVETVWESGEIPSFSAEMMIPTVALRPGHTYRARVRHKDSSNRWSHWSAPVEFVASEPDLSELRQNLMITEIMYHPAGGLDAEFIELQNIGANTLDLTDVRFTKGVDFDFPAGTMLAAGEFMLVVSNLAGFESAYGAGLPVVGEWQSGDNLSNGGEQLKLSFGAGTAIHDFLYDDAPPWPTIPDGAGFSLVLNNPSSAPDHALASNWRASSVVNGSPGAVDGIAYANWKTASFTPAELADPAVSGDNADPDKDGVSNVEEFYFGTAPKTAGGGAFSVTGSGDTIEFQRRRGIDADMEIGLSMDLVVWHPDAAATLLSAVDNGDGTEQVTMRIDDPLISETRLFMRLLIIAR